ncbi:hypothetical protein D030_1617A, partial [Vibrio parahaemolyticus AQ3810]
MSWV